MKRVGKIINIGVPFTPIRHVGKPKVINGYKLTLSYGGGMGGSCETVYAYKEDISFDETHYTVVSIEGRDMHINTDYIVKSEEVIFIKTRYENMGNDNVTRTYGNDCTITRCVYGHEKFKVVDAYVGNDGDYSNLLIEIHK